MASAEVGSLRVSLTLATAAFTAGAKIVADTARTTADRIRAVFSQGAAGAAASLATISAAAAKQLGVGVMGEIAKIRTAVFTMFGPAGIIIAGLSAAVGHFASQAGAAIGDLNTIVDRHNDLTNEIGGLYDNALERGVEYGRGMSRVFQALAQQQLPTLLANLQAEMTRTFNPENGPFANRRLMDDFAEFNEEIQGLRVGLLDFDTFMIRVQQHADRIGASGMGAELITLTQGLKDSANALSSATQQARGVSFDTPVGGARERAAAAAQAAAERRQAIQASVADIIAGNRAELDAENLGHNERLKALDTALAQNLLKREQYQSLVEAETKSHEDRVTDIHREALNKRRMMQAEWLSSVGDVLASIGSVIGKEGEKAFKINKRLALAQAGIDTASAVLKALASAPPPLSFIRAAAAGLAGAAQMAAIARSQPGSASTAPTPSGSDPGAGAAASGGGQQSAPQQTTIHLQGGPMYSEQGIRDLIKQINKAQPNGPKIDVY